MDLLLDTHTLIWFLNGNKKDLSIPARTEIENSENSSFVSVVSLWEMAIKMKLGTLTFKPGYDNLLTLIDQNGFELLPITFQRTQTLLTLEMHHRDPFDRLLIAQCIVEGMTFISKDSNISKYPVRWLW
ncbi:type II toxin-antitoxin system VapC family toxin [Larkinella rosea]|uniref:Type II toxin-antitoxin system VapC family toxin n=1 Tax=Larkinella rosea TaxID=2025312 RepID=A0A3P1BUY3_9BACT|nr:type II toxin-antitoxin system VapC family toxin [Larkinella rosea]RRB04918.1 type II toxin-antitoxin system VapC family toxin [Larkinella rosea]